MKNKITLKELARLLHVSVSTVSKALHDSPEISPKTIERVKELAALHNYRPNPVAVNLKSSKSGTIGVIVPNIENSFFAKVLSGIEAQAQKEGLQVITYISNESLDREKQIADLLTSGFVDGVLLAIAEETQRK
ncbi:MAG: LacI family DNA-binding transcriptional regulator, partial [Salegentibacter sp.]